jgi:hypothetical protein
MQRLLQKLMVDKNKFWLCFGGILLLGILGLVGAILGQTIMGYIIYGVGTAGTIALFVLTFLKTDFYKEGRLKLFIIGFSVGLLLAAGILLLVNTGSSAAATASGFDRSALTSGANSGNMPQMPSGDTSGTFPQGGAMPGGQFTMPTGDATGSTASTFPSGNMPSRASSGNNTLKPILGWSLLGLAGASLGFGVFLFLKKKIEINNQRWQVLLLGFLLGASMGVAPVLLFASSTASPRSDPTMAMNGQILPDMAGTGVSTTTAGETTAATTAAPVEQPSNTPIIAATETPEPTATTDTISRLVVCLDADVILAKYLYNIPSESGSITGTVPAAGCFTINGRSAANPGWYHLAPGQDGFGGVQIYVDDNVIDLWIHTDNIDATEANLNRLQDIVVTPEN